MRCEASHRPKPSSSLRLPPNNWPGSGRPANHHLLPPPVELPNIEINLFWHRRYIKDPANRWLRQLMFDLISDTR